MTTPIPPVNAPSKTNSQLVDAIQQESARLAEFYHWLEQAMPPLFFEEVSQENILLIARSLMGFPQQEYFSNIHLKRGSIVLCLDSSDADLRIMQNFELYGIKNYQTYISKAPPPLPGIKANLRVAVIYFTEAVETVETPYAAEAKEELRQLVKARDPALKDEDLNKLLSGMNTRFLRSLPMDRLVMALDLFFKAKTRDNCQYEVRYDENWEETGSASMQIVLAWRNCPKHNFLYRMARTVQRHGLTMRRVNATYINPYGKDNTLIMTLWLHGSNGQAAWDAADIVDFLRELVTIKYFPSFDLIDENLVSKGIVSGNMANLLRTMVKFINQCLVHVDANVYTSEAVEAALCRHPELTTMVCKAFKLKFDPDHVNYEGYLELRETLLHDIGKLDTGQEEMDRRCRTILLQAASFVHHVLKTNFYRSNYTAHSFRLDPKFLDNIPFDRTAKFPETPFAVFFIKGMHFFGFHIRFKDLARGGLRTLIVTNNEHAVFESNNMFTECYNLAWTQHMKNKDIPEGGAKGIIFLRPGERLESEAYILKRELEASQIDPTEIAAQLEKFRKEQWTEHLYAAQRSFIESLLSIVNCEPDGRLKAKNIVDYWKRPEYLYLGPDENMHDEMIQWIADFSKRYQYKPGSSFISGKPHGGINHKEYGVTSLGVNVYMEAVLKELGIDPAQKVFTVKMSGGPDGDVAGNQIHNLYRLYPKTAKLLALIDVSGTIHDPIGLDLEVLDKLFHEAKPIRFYPPAKLNEGGFLVDKQTTRKPTAYVQQTLCWRKVKGELVEDWLSGSDMNALLRLNVHQTKTDVFIPSGGRPRTLNSGNIKEFFDDNGKPTSQAIVEGANLYIDNKARLALEKAGVLIIKDSSANKTGVICSSFEVLCGLAMGDERFIAHKPELVKEILERLKLCASLEAQLLLRTRRETGQFLTDISNQTSKKINEFTYQLLDYLDQQTLGQDVQDPLVRCFLSYCLPLLRSEFREEVLREIPEHHKKAAIACQLGAHLVYSRGLEWSPSVTDILPVLLEGVLEV